MGREEQIEEREVLDSIFPEEIQDLSETEFRISILLDIVPQDGEDFEAPTILLQVKYSENYPDEPPVLDVLGPPNAASHPLFSVSTDKQQLLDGLTETIEENLGMAMVFTLVSTLKENAEQLIAERQAALRQVEEQRILAVEREENKKFHGTPVTPETFTKWRDDFKQEMDDLRKKEEEEEEAAEKKKRGGKDAVVQLTGKQLWERGLAGKGDEDEDEEDAPVEDLENLKVQA